jgi:chaperone BCS1
MIMTTNYPKTLDSALIRPGRVDLQVEFTLATHDQIRDMYKCMYTEESSNSTRNTKPPETIQVDAHKSKAAWDDLCSDVCPYMTESSESQSKRLGKMAKMFADMLPEKVFSPAELQGFLLERKRNPEGALREVEKWRDERIKSMAEANKEAREP